MSKLLAAAESKSVSRDSRIAFATEGAGYWPKWDRFITVDGKRAHHLGNICGTCPFVFQRLEGANDKISPQELTKLFRTGISGLEQPLTQRVMEILPAGEYRVLLLSFLPQLIAPSMHGDYFVEEQVEAWGPDTGDDGGAHDPETEYYRADTRVLAPGTTLFEFVVPMFPTRSLRQETINSYLWALKQESIPTALAISVLDVKESSDSVPSIKTHWCLVHFLLDGHHKVFAASQARKPMTMLSFLAIDKGVSGVEDIERLLNILPR